VRRLLVLDSDLGGTATLGQLVAVAVGVAILAAWESGASLRKWSAWLTFRSTLAGLRAVVIVCAERSVAANRAWSLAIPRWQTTKTTRASSEAGVERHISEAIDNSRGVSTVIQASRCHQSWSASLLVFSVELLKTRDILAQCGREACGRWNW
jgi:hypothetical protein